MHRRRPQRGETVKLTKERIESLRTEASKCKLGSVRREMKYGEILGAILDHIAATLEEEAPKPRPSWGRCKCVCGEHDLEASTMSVTTQEGEFHSRLQPCRAKPEPKPDLCGGKPGEPRWWNKHSPPNVPGCAHSGWHELNMACLTTGGGWEECTKCPGCADCRPKDDWATLAVDEWLASHGITADAKQRSGLIAIISKHAPR